MSVSGVEAAVANWIDDCIDAMGRGALGPGKRSDDSFSRLALDVFAHQYESVPLYRRLCELRGVSPSAVEHWSGIPAAPADLFKESWNDDQMESWNDDQMETRSDDRTETRSDDGRTGAVVFLSSGTTQGQERRSRHVVSPHGLELYRRSSLAHFEAMAMPDAPGPMQVLVLGPTSATHPSSSLGHMYQFVVERFASKRDADDSFDATGVLGADGNLDLDAAIAWLEAAAASTRPVLLLALSSTITAVFETLRARKLALRLPADSRLIDTGGGKGGRTMSRAGILKAAWRFLHIPAYLCTGEYGMTELLSQFYDDALRSRWSGANMPRAKVGPPWTRTLVVDPATLAPVADGERGILRHFDLANCGSVSAVQTLDIGVVRGRGFEVIGRASGAETRGCSQLMTRLFPEL